MNYQQGRSTWLIFPGLERITVAGQRLILTDFAIMPDDKFIGTFAAIKC
jgi:hypothetical protein